mmetsp:Transcript_68721/g.128213  ORF Transcript_68721/g.128213 Transcript_68721/m.128213 type:complete len:118 (+) Transcript_68721:579-932(+)
MISWRKPMLAPPSLKWKVPPADGSAGVPLPSRQDGLVGMSDGDSFARRPPVSASPGKAAPDGAVRIAGPCEEALHWELDLARASWSRPFLGEVSADDELREVKHKSCWSTTSKLLLL